MKMFFDELAIVSILKAESPGDFIVKATEILPYYDENDTEDKEMMELIQNAIKKVETMTLEEFASLDLPYI